MNNPALYAQSNRLVHTIVQDFLKKYIPLVRWRQDGGGSAMDIGCGPGDITKQILFPVLPESQRELVATDISPQMLQYARNHHQHPRITYNVLDICTEKLPQVYCNRFDQVFCLMVLHFIHDHKQAIVNMFKMVQPGGDLLSVFFFKNPTLDVMLKVASSEHWKPYIKEPKKAFSVLHEIENVEELLYSLLQQVGFEDITCERTRSVYEFENMTEWTDIATSVNGFLSQLPANLKEKLRQEYCNELKNRAITDGYTDSNKETVCLPYTVINIHARRP